MVDNGAVQQASNELDKIIADLQKRCHLTLTVDASQVQQQIDKQSKTWNPNKLNSFNNALHAMQNKMTNLGLTQPTKEMREFAEALDKVNKNDGTGSGRLKALQIDARDSLSKLSGLKKYTNSVTNLRASLREKGVLDDTAELKAFESELAKVKANGGDGFENLSSSAIAAAQSVRTATREVRDLEQAQKQLQTLNTNGLWLQNQNAQLDSFTNLPAKEIADARAAAKAISDTYAELSKSGTNATADQWSAASDQLKKYLILLNQLSKQNTLEGQKQSWIKGNANLASEMQNYWDKYGANLRKNSELLTRFNKLQEDIADPSKYNANREAWATFQRDAQRAGTEVETVRQRMSNLFSQHFSTALIMLAINGLRRALQQLWQDIRAVNDALVQTQIVTGLSGSALEQYTSKAYDAASKSRDTITNILNSATAFGRLGYDSDLSVQLAELTSMYSKLGDVDTDDATDAITALMKAFNLKNADDIESALDKLIYVGNNFPISAAGLGEGLNNAGSALASAGNSLEQTLALLMAANATVQDPSKSSTAMRTITARIRNTKTELDDLGETLDEKYDTVAKYQAELKGLTGVDILDSTGKQFRSTYDILSDLASKWKNLDDAKRAAVTTMLAGTRNQDIFASLMQNFPEAERALAGVGDSAGLMEQRFEAVTHSISGAISELSNAWSRFGTTFANSDFVIGAVNALTQFVTVLEKLTKTFGGFSVAAFAASFKIIADSVKKATAAVPGLRAAQAAMEQAFRNGGEKAAADAIAMLSSRQRDAVIATSALTAAEKERIEAALEGRVATDALGNAIETAGAKAKLASSSFNWIVAAITITITLLSAYIGWVEQSEQAAQQAAESARQATVDSIQSAKSVVDSYSSAADSVKSYQEQIAELQKQLDPGKEGTEAYIEAKIKLAEVQQKIVDQFGEEAGAVKGVTESLEAYSNRLDEVSKESKYYKLLDAGNLSDTNAALRLFGVNTSGKIDKGSLSNTVRVSGVSNASVNYHYNALTKASQYKDALTYWGRQVFGAKGSPMERIWRDGSLTFKAISPSATRISDGLFRNKVDKLTLTTFDITTGGKTVAEIVDLLEKQVEYLKSNSNIEYANAASSILSQYKKATGYDDAKAVYEEWVDGYLRYGNEYTKKYYSEAMDLLQGAELSETVGDIETAGSQLADALGLLSELIRENGANLPEWIKDHIETIISENQLKSAILNGSIMIKDQRFESAAPAQTVTNGRIRGSSRTRDIYVPVDKELSGYTKEWLVTAGLLTAEVARAEGDETYAAWQMYQKLIPVAQQYNTTVEKLLDTYVQLGKLRESALNNDKPVIRTAHNPSDDFNDKYSAFDQKTAQKGYKNLGDLQEQMNQYLGAKKLFDAAITKDDTGKIINVKGTKKDLEALNKFFDTDFKELSKDAANAFDDMFGDVGEELYGALEANLKKAIELARDNGVEISKYLNADTGEIDFDGLYTALDNLQGVAGSASAASVVAMAQEFKNFKMTFTWSQDENGGFSISADGGTGNWQPKSPGGGGGGGKKSKLSKEYENAADALKALISLWKSLLNFYEEGSEKWIARQTQIIDKYKAGVEIAQKEYDRLIKSGLSIMDEEVQKVAEAIADYQEDIFKESETLWKAVRQNQIDAIQHTKDQNDAVISLENTHHDLLTTIRDERRELEDELKAARDAYSETMTPQELDALFSEADFAELMGKLAEIENDALSMYTDYREQIESVSEDETYLIEHITDEFERQYELKMKEYEVAKAELGVARAQRELENTRNELNVMMLKDGMWQWVADPQAVLEAENKLAEAQRELADAQDEMDFQSMVKAMEANSSEMQKHIDALEALTFSMDELANQLHLFTDKVYANLLKYIDGSSKSILKKYEGSTAVPAFDTGGAIRYGGLALLHDNEVVFNSQDATKLWKLVHNADDDSLSLRNVLQDVQTKFPSFFNGDSGAKAAQVIDNSIHIPGGIVVQGETAQQLITILRSIVAPYQP